MKNISPVLIGTFFTINLMVRLMIKKTDKNVFIFHSDDKSIISFSTTSKYIRIK